MRKVWAVMDAPAGKRMAPFLSEMVAWLRAGGELDLTDEVAVSRVKILGRAVESVLRGNLSYG